MRQWLVDCQQTDTISREGNECVCVCVCIQKHVRCYKGQGISIKESLVFDLDIILHSLMSHTCSWFFPHLSSPLFFSRFTPFSFHHSSLHFLLFLYFLALTLPCKIFLWLQFHLFLPPWVCPLSSDACSTFPSLLPHSQQPCHFSFILLPITIHPASRLTLLSSPAW